MAQQIQYTCEVCGVVHGPTNHWFMAWHRPDGIFIRTWDRYDCQDPEMKHLCGESCAATHLTRYLAAVKEGGKS